MDYNTALSVQTKLKELGYDPGPLDGDWGWRSARGLKDFQGINNLRMVDGLWGPESKDALFGPSPIPHPAIPRPSGDAAPVASKAYDWPSQGNVSAVFGPAGGPKATAGSCILPFPFRLAWDLDTKVSKFACHSLVAPALCGIFSDAAKSYGESGMRELGLDIFSGCFNDRAMRGGSAKSMHAWGIAVDLDDTHNQLRWSRNGTAKAGYTDKARFAQPEYVPFWKIVESYGAVSLGRHADYDWMHFQFARL